VADTVTAAGHSGGVAPAATAPAAGTQAWRSIPKAFRLVKFSPRTLSAAQRADAPDAPSCAAAETCFQLVSNVTGNYCLNANNDNGLYDGVPMQIWTCNWNSNDLWEFGSCHTEDDVSFCQLKTVWNTGYCLNADDSYGLYNGSYLQLWTCNVASPYNDVWAYYDATVSCYSGCLGVEDGSINDPYIATVDLGNGTPGNGTTVWMWLSGDETSPRGIIWSANVK
jgi:hypothetical protein